MQPLNRREVLLAAARLLDEKGWGTGSSAMYWDNPDGMCILGAVAYAAGARIYPSGDRRVAYKAAIDVIGCDSHFYPFAWNDYLPHESEEDKMRSREVVQKVLRVLAEDESLTFAEALASMAKEDGISTAEQALV